MLGEFITYVVKEGAIIAGAPLIFVLALIVCAALIFLILRFSFSQHIKTLNERIALRDDQLNDIKRRLDTPGDVDSKIEELKALVHELSFGKWTPLTPEQQLRIKTGLGQLAPGEIDINMSSDARAFGNYFIKIFQDAGWKVRKDYFLSPGLQGLFVDGPKDAPLKSLADLITAATGEQVVIRPNKSQRLTFGIGERPD